VTIETAVELKGMQRIGCVVAEARDTMIAALRAGVSTAELDDVGRAVLERHGARSAPRVVYGFPGWTCISVNADLAHGVPTTERVLAAGDLVNIDVSAELDGFWADTGASAPVGNVTRPLRSLLAATRSAQLAGMFAAKAGQRVNQIAKAVGRVARARGFRVVEELGGHGIGRGLHEAPNVSNVYDRRDNTRLKLGQVITVEPFFTIGNPRIEEAEDGWTLRTVDGGVGAQFEHTFVVTRGRPINLTAAVSA